MGEARPLLLAKAKEWIQHEPTAKSAALALSLAHQPDPDAGLALITVVCGSLSLLVSFFDKTGRTQHRIAQVWARGCVWGSGCTLTVRGAENLRKCPVAVYASNHTSYMDTPVIFAALPFQFRILAKKELWPIAFIGWYLDRSGQIPIDTDNPHSTLSSLGAA